MAAYNEHSKMLDVYKNTNEALSGSTSTAAYMGALDLLMHSATNQIIECSDWLDVQVGHLIAWYSIHTKRKVSISEKSQSITYLIQFLLADDRDTKKEKYEKAYLERSITRAFNSCFADALSQTAKLVEQAFLNPHEVSINIEVLPQVQHVVRTFALAEPSITFGLSKTLNYWIEKEKEFRGQILQKYTRMIIVTAARDAKKYNYRIDIEEFVQNYLAAALKAIDKSSVGDMGTLTTYIQSWLKNSLLATVNSFNYTLAYTVPSNKLHEHSQTTMDTDTMMIMIGSEGSITDLTGFATTSMGADWTNGWEDVREEMESQDSIDRVRKLAKAVDFTGVGRILLGIDEALNQEEVMRLQAVALH